ncbi:MAG: hypothetical protein KBT58_03360, partial [Bizionia sp.]|nr:hypothetical protein [Bizionia sp.]
MKISKRLLLIIAVLSVGAVFLHKLISSYEEFEQKKIQAKLHKTHSDAIIRAQAGINVYAALVSSIKSYTKNKSAFPEELELQSYLNDILKDIKFNDSIVISYYDNNHIFKYVITPNAIDPMGIKGDSAKLLLGKKRLAEFQMLLKTDDIHLLHPINVKEGWV